MIALFPSLVSWTRPSKISCKMKQFTTQHPHEQFWWFQFGLIFRPHPRPIDLSLNELSGRCRNRVISNLWPTILDEWMSESSSLWPTERWGHIHPWCDTTMRCFLHEAVELWSEPRRDRFIHSFIHSWPLVAIVLLPPLLLHLLLFACPGGHPLDLVQTSSPSKHQRQRERSILVRRGCGHRYVQMLLACFWYCFLWQLNSIHAQTTSCCFKTARKTTFEMLRNRPTKSGQGLTSTKLLVDQILYESWFNELYF